MVKRRIFKIILLGDQGVGKATFRMRFLGYGFSRSYGRIIGTNFAVKKINNYLGEEVIAQIWELTPEDNFKNIREVYYRGATGGILVFDISRRETLENLHNWVLELIKHNEGLHVPLFIVGSKADLRENSNDSISRKEGVNFAKQISQKINFEIPYIETSILNSDEIENGFRIFVDNITNFLVYTNLHTDEKVEEFIKIYGKSLKLKLLEFKKEKLGISFQDFNAKLDPELISILDTMSKSLGIHRDLILNKIISDYFEL
ncbi:MAG: GTPase KRas precursor [Candidatus Heimdallarchaeota archaeon LC_2]|nr:MAG: GTPase KRas precursor [Candidatus Heimdallarchaeota archaeon LC_2]